MGFACFTTSNATLPVMLFSGAGENKVKKNIFFGRIIGQTLLIFMIFGIFEYSKIVTHP